MITSKKILIPLVAITLINFFYRDNISNKIQDHLILKQWEKAPSQPAQSFLDIKNYSTTALNYLERVHKLIPFQASLLISYRGKIILKKEIPQSKSENNIHFQYFIGSITKLITAIAILQLQDQTLLTLNDPICLHLKDFCHTPLGKQTIRQLLNHTSGLPNYRCGLFQTMKYLEFDIEKQLSLDYFLENTKNCSIDSNHSDSFEYSNLGYIVLTKIIEVISHKTYSQYLQEHIFRSLNMRNSGVADEQTTEGIQIKSTYGAGSIYSTTEDLWRLHQTIYQYSNFPSLQFLKRSSIKNEGYNLGVYILNKKDKTSILHYSNGQIGSYYSEMFRFPREEVSVILLFKDWPREFLLKNFKENFYKLITKKKYQLP